MSQSEESSAQEMKQKSEEKASETQQTKMATEDKEEEEGGGGLPKTKEDHPVSDASLIPYSSPTPSLRSCKPPSALVHSSPDLSIHNNHSSVSHAHSPSQNERFSPPPPTQKPPAQSSPDLSTSDDHCNAINGVSPIEDERFSPPPPEVLVANRFQGDPQVVTKVDRGVQEGGVGVDGDEECAGTGVGGSGNRRLRPDVSNLLKSKEKAKLNKTLLGLRIVALVFCLISFSVLATDTKQGWALDSFYLYKEFRYSLSVSVIGFLYSVLQVCYMVKCLITRKHMVDHYLRGYFDFTMDQILTYLLMSASSSAAIRAYDWESNWGKDKFVDMANASVGLSFVAFVTFALTSLVSGYMLCRFR